MPSATTQKTAETTLAMGAAAATGRRLVTPAWAEREVKEGAPEETRRGATAASGRCTLISPSRTARWQNSAHFRSDTSRVSVDYALLYGALAAYVSRVESAQKNHPFTISVNSRRSQILKESDAAGSQLSGNLPGGFCFYVSISSAAA